MEHTVITAAKTSRKAESEPLKMLNRIGSTVYSVSIRFNEASKETLNDKVYRLIKNEITKIPSPQTGKLPERSAV
jgi:hypothetical protein